MPSLASENYSIFLVYLCQKFSLSGSCLQTLIEFIKSKSNKIIDFNLKCIV